MPWNKCQKCGKTFMIGYLPDYAYKRNTLVFCSYSCMRSFDKELEQKRQREKLRREKERLIKRNAKKRTIYKRGLD